MKKVGNAHVFEPVVTRKAAHHRLITELLDFFGGSARPLMAHLAETGKLSLEDIREMEGLISEQENVSRQDTAAKSASTKASKKR